MESIRYDHVVEPGLSKFKNGPLTEWKRNLGKSSRIYLLNDCA